MKLPRLQPATGLVANPEEKTTVKFKTAWLTENPVYKFNLKNLSGMQMNYTNGKNE